MGNELGRSAGLTGLADLCRSLGVDPYRLAKSAGAPVAALTDPDLKLPTAVVGRMLELAARRGGVEDVGLRLAEHRRLSNMGPVALAARDQPSLRKALGVMAQYLWMQNEALSLTLEEAGDMVIASVRLIVEPGHSARQATELSCGVLCRNIRDLKGDAWRPQAVLFRHGPPGNLRTHRRVFGVTPEFHQDFDGLLLTKAELDAPLKVRDPAMARLAEGYLRQLAQGRSERTVDRAGELILLLLPTGGCTAERVARHLGYDRRTLHRHLAAEGASFSALLDDKRRQLVGSLMADRSRSLAAIADLAGFASPSSFTHWARRVLGASPRALRNRKS